MHGGAQAHGVAALANAYDRYPVPQHPEGEDLSQAAQVAEEVRIGKHRAAGHPPAAAAWRRRPRRAEARRRRRLAGRWPLVAERGAGPARQRQPRRRAPGAGAAVRLAPRRRRRQRQRATRRASALARWRQRAPQPARLHPAAASCTRAAGTTPGVTFGGVIGGDPVQRALVQAGGGALNNMSTPASVAFVANVRRTLTPAAVPSVASRILPVPACRLKHLWRSVGLARTNRNSAAPYSETVALSGCAARTHKVLAVSHLLCS